MDELNARNKNFHQYAVLVLHLLFDQYFHVHYSSNISEKKKKNLTQTIIRKLEIESV